MMEGSFGLNTNGLHENRDGYLFRTDVILSVEICIDEANRCKFGGDAFGKDTLF